jgi:hypothetical protein
MVSFHVRSRKCCPPAFTSDPENFGKNGIGSGSGCNSEAFDQRIRFSPHDFLEALASPMARAGFPHGDVDSESRSWGQKLPPRGSAAENGSRRDGVLRVDGASRRWEHRRRYGDFVKRAPR